MKILGIETSCDETAACVIEANGEFGNDLPVGKAGFTFDVLGNALYSQIAIHAPYGGVFPNLAKREHAKNLVPLMTQALEQSSLLKISQGRSLGNSENPDGSNPISFPYQGPSLVKEMLSREEELYSQLEVFLNKFEKPNIDCIAVTHGPGLEPALWVGVNFARALSTAWNIPLIAVNHMEGHIIMSMVEEEVDNDTSDVSSVNGKLSTVNSLRLSTVNFPLLSLLISGGHTELVLSREFMQYEVIGQTRDDAVGEAFDKVARLLGLPYPGGPEISRLAAQARVRGLTSDTEVKPRTISFTSPMLHSDDFDFSFSGIKTEVRKYVESQTEQGSTLLTRSNLEETLDDSMKMEIARAFEEAVTKVLVAKTMRAVEEFGAETVLVGGGVSANTYIRQQLASACNLSAVNCKLLVPPADLATDNALMIALAGYFHTIKNDFADPTTLRADGNLRLA